MNAARLEGSGICRQIIWLTGINTGGDYARFEVCAGEPGDCEEEY